MLDALRRGASKILMFVLFSVLIFSFAIWGIGDMVRNVATGPIASIGKTEVPAEDFTTALQMRRQALSRQFGQPITPEQSRAYGIDASVLGELVNSKAVLNHAEAMGLKLSDATIAGAIRNDPLFQGGDKAFSKPIFDERMRQAGFTERRYFAERRASEVREQVTDALSESVVPPNTLIEIAHKYSEEIRTAQYITLDAAKAPKPADPDDEKLKAHFEQTKAQYMVPEQRQITVMSLTNDMLKQRIKVEDTEVKSTWEQSKPSWDLPERRRLQQIVYKTKISAQEAHKAILSGKGFLMAALEENGAQGRIDQGLIARREISDQKVAAAAFALPLNQISEPIEIRGGALLLRVTEVTPAKASTFEEVQATIRENLEQTRLSETSTKLREQIEDLRGARQPLAKIGKDLNIPVTEVASIDSRGLAPDGKPALTLAGAPKILASAFEGGKDVPREAVSLDDGSEAWVDVVAVIPGRQKTLDEVKDDLTKAWITVESRKALATQAQGLVDRIKAATTIDAIGRDLGLKVETSLPFKRNAPTGALTASAVRQAFSLAKGGAASADTADGKTRIVYIVSEIKIPVAPTKEETDKLAAELGDQLRRDALDSYIATLRAQQGVTINEAVYKRAVGLDQAQ